MPTATLPISSGQHTNVDERGLRDRNARVINWMLDESGALISRPGLATFSTFEPESGASDESAYVELLFPYKEWVVACLNDGRTFTLDEDGEQVDRTGVRLSGHRYPSATVDQDGTLLLSDGGVALKWPGYGTTLQLSAGFAPRSTHLAVVQRYLVGNDSGNDDIYYTTTLDHSSWDELRSFQAESRTDPCIAILAASNFLYLFGEETVDVYYPTNSDSPPFARAYTLPRGLIGARGVVEVDGQIYFMDTRRRICRLNDRTPEVISLEIERSLLELTEASDVVAHRVDFEGRHLLVWHFPQAGTAYVYDYGLSTRETGRWYEWRGWSASRWSELPIAAYAYHPDWNKHVCASGQTVYEMSGTGSDAGAEIRRVVRTGWFTHGSFSLKRSKSLKMRLARGTTTDLDASPEIMVRFRDEDMRWWDYMHYDLGATGDRATLGVEIDGCGQYQERQWEFVCTADAPDLTLYPPEEDVDILER